MTAVILSVGLLVGIQTDPDITSAPGAELTFNILDWVINIVFTFEFLFKIVALEKDYFNSSWNNFDLVVLLSSYFSGGGSLVTMLRLLRLLRVLKLVKRFPQLAIIVDALLMGLSSIGFIGLILVLVYYIFAIIGIYFFRENDPWHFGNLGRAMLTLFRVSTMEDWTDVMYINIYGCAEYGYDDEMRCENSKASGFLAIFYFCCFVLLAAFILLTLFVGVVCESMDEATSKREAEDDVRSRLLAFAEKNGIDLEAVKTFQEVFAMLDMDGSGSIEVDELVAGLETVGVETTEDEVHEWMAGMDTNENAMIDCAEFVEFMFEMRKAKEKRLAKNASADDTKDSAEPLETLEVIN